MIIPKEYYYESQSFLEAYGTKDAQDRTSALILDINNLKDLDKANFHLEFTIFVNVRFDNKTALENYNEALRYIKDVEQLNNPEDSRGWGETLLKNAISHMRLGIIELLKMRWFFASNGRNVKW